MNQTGEQEAKVNCKNVFSNVLECIGNTPLIRINRMNNPAVTFYIKFEAKNPAGSVKDRAALSMIEEAERQGQLVAGKIIVEATSGNTGIGLAMVAAVKGYESFSPCRRLPAWRGRRSSKRSALTPVYPRVIGHRRGDRRGLQSGEGKPQPVLHYQPVQ